MQTLKKFIFLLSPAELKQSFLLIIMSFVMAVLELIGIASVMPFIAILTNPDLIENNVIIGYLYSTSFAFGVKNQKEFLFFLGLLVFVLLLISILFKAFTNYFKLHFTQMREYTISKRLVEGYLHQPYAWFLNRHSADLGKSILSEVGIIVGHGLIPLFELIAKSFVATLIIIFLLIIDIEIALIAGIALSMSFAIIYKLTRGFLRRIGKEREIANQHRFTTVSEAFNSTKEVKVAGLEEPYLKRFEIPAKTYAKNIASAQVISELPRFALEAIAFGGMLVVILYLMSKSGNFIDIIPIIAIYAFAGYRLLPALQGIYVAVTQLRFVSATVDKLYLDLLSLKKASQLNFDKKIFPKEHIVLENIYYDYPNSHRTALKNINLKIPVKSKVGIIGPTGSGKTTIVDIIMGLLEPKNGALKIDDISIKSDNSRAWQQSLGYVPQQINLIDDTISANIAFGIEHENINHERVEKASKIANLHDFIIDELEEKYETLIGEKGVRLSGGQRQRIGIARALYDNPKVLILDEATSALDIPTEKKVLDLVRDIAEDITIITITHRINTVKDYDIIFLIDKGEIIGHGNYEYLLKNNNLFKSSALIS